MMQTIPAPPNFSLAGKRAVVTGASRGIGLAASAALAAAGAEIVMLARTPGELDDAVASVREVGGKAVGRTIDVTDVASVEAVVTEIEDIDILVANAGTNRPKPMLDVTEDDYDAIFGLNVRSAFFVARAVSRGMVARGHGGSIIFMSSQMGHVGAPNRTVYCASKHAIEGLSKAMAVELGSHGIRVNTVAPTFIETPMTEPFFRSEGFREAVLKQISLGRVGRPDDITGAVQFLASDASQMVTGMSLKVDGGWTAH